VTERVSTTGKGRNYILGAAWAVLIAVGMFLLFAVWMEFLETSIVLSSIFMLYLVYCWFVLPAIDRRTGRSGAARTAAEAASSGTKKYDLRFFSRFPPFAEVIAFLAITVVSFLLLHLLVLLMHEFSHSMFAYLLGVKQDPWNIIYGNWIGSHWDENVDYSALFSAGRGSTAAAIAFAGPLSNIVLFFVTAGLMSVKSVKNHRWAYHSVFWTGIITFVMVFEYVFTRSFLQNDDFGNINHGLGISPWPIFLAGTILGILGLYYIFAYKMPEYYAIVTPHERSLQYVAVSAVSFVIFLFYIGLRITAFPAVPEWWCGVIGIVALFIVPFIAGPGRRWVQESMRRSAVQGSLPSDPGHSRS